MDQDKIGVFIADCRRQKGLTRYSLEKYLGCLLQNKNVVSCVNLLELDNNISFSLLNDSGRNLITICSDCYHPAENR
jgi:hypothetical protein